MFFKSKTDPTQPLLEAMQLIAEAYHPLHPPPGKHEYLLGLAKKLDPLVPKAPAECQPPLRYHQAWILAASGGAAEAAKILDDLAKGSLFLPEALWLNIQISAAGTDESSNQRRWNIEDQLGARLPISIWGRLRDGRLEEKEAERLGRLLPDSPGAIIPNIQGEKLLAIARLFEEMKMAEEAAMAYREAVYGGFTPFQFPEAGAETWTSSETAGIWLSTARLDAALGKTAWCVQALGLAMASSRQEEKAALDLLKGLFAQKPSPPPAAPEASRLKQIAAHYGDSNLHPRALSALEAAAKVPGADVKALLAEYSQAWEKLVAGYIKGREPTRFLFGKKAAGTPPGQLAPAAFPYQAP
ncbi:MAG: hypothetical protein HY717_03815 [Planctomycetes bacterium]|nr:hypothetical protein [Planctomycetota bacterium]